MSLWVFTPLKEQYQPEDMDEAHEVVEEVEKLHVEVKAAQEEDQGG